MSVRAKFRVTQHVVTQWGPDESHKTTEVHLSAVYGKDGSENASWSKATPTGSLKMTITNADAVAQLPLNKEFYLDFTPAESPATST